MLRDDGGMMDEKDLEIPDEVLKTLNENIHKRRNIFAPTSSLNHYHYRHRYQKIEPMPAEIEEALDKKIFERIKQRDGGIMQEEPNTLQEALKLTAVPVEPEEEKYKFRQLLETIEIQARTNLLFRGWTAGLNLPARVLIKMYELENVGDPVEERHIVKVLSEEDPEFTARNIRQALKYLEDHELIEVDVPDFLTGYLVPPRLYTLKEKTAKTLELFKDVHEDDI